jgi:hypothetical protein
VPQSADALALAQLAAVAVAAQQRAVHRLAAVFAGFVNQAQAELQAAVPALLLAAALALA